MQKFPMTAPGLQRLEEELKMLKSVERPAIIRAIAGRRPTDAYPGQLRGLRPRAFAVDLVAELCGILMSTCAVAVWPSAPAAATGSNDDEGLAPEQPVASTRAHAKPAATILMNAPSRR